METSMLQYFIIALIISIVLFFVLRELNCWYWKINERIKLIEEQNRLLNLLIKQNTTLTGVKIENISNDETDNTKKADVSENSSARNPETINIIKELIEKEKKKTWWQEGNRQEIIKCLAEYCDSKNSCVQLIQEYQKRFNSSLIEDLKKLSSSYASIKELLSVFIEFEVIESEFPHNIK